MWYLNPIGDDFEGLTKGIFVDKTELIAYVNSALGTSNRFMCVTRPRRFGKSFTAQMLVAFYAKGADSRKLFEPLKIARSCKYIDSPPFLRTKLKPVPWDQYLNQINVLYWDMSAYTSISGGVDFLGELQCRVCRELRQAFPFLDPAEKEEIPLLLQKIKEQTGERFFVVIDEWDSPFREAKDEREALARYIDFLRRLFKSESASRYLRGAYMTGILPIKKYNTQSALSNFDEFSMLTPGALAPFVGFDETEVCTLCKESGMDFDSMRQWYDGYELEDAGHIYNPNSVVLAIRNNRCQSYWTKSSSYESLLDYIELDIDGLKNAVMRLIGGSPCKIDAVAFQNDLTAVNTKDDVFTVLVHFGYLGFHAATSEVYIPNEEIRQEFIRSMRNGKRKELVKAIELSDKLLDATLLRDSKTVADILQQVHLSYGAPRHYHNEQILRSVVQIAYLSAVDHYRRFEEIATGRGFADMLFLPNQGSSKPALIVELKNDASAQKAVSQIHEKQYGEVLGRFGYQGKALFVGINYNSKTGKHTCEIEAVDCAA